MKSIAPTRSDFDEILNYLPVLYADGFSATKRRSAEESLPTIAWPVYEPIVQQFFDIAAQACWTDSTYHPAEIGEVIRDPVRVAKASLDQIKSMLTWCVRGERFCDGHWGGVIEDGCIRNVLLRLQELRPSQ